MKVFEVTDHDTPPRLADRPVPAPGPGEVRVRIEACGLNFADLLMARGTYQETPKPPFTLGMEVCGVVDACGPDVRAPAPGERVAVFGGHGGLAEYGVFAAARCVRVPAEMPSDIAAGFLVAYGTSHLALTRRARLRAEETLLVTGAAGGVGLTAVEIGATLGARVVAVARGADKLAVARCAGAHETVDADLPDLAQRLKALGGADVVYETVGGGLFRAAMKACRPEARVLLIGFASGELPEIRANHLLVKNVAVEGIYWGGYLKFAPGHLTGSLDELMGWYRDGRLAPHVSHVLPLERTAEALELLAARRSTGKVVVRPGDPG